MAYDPPVPLTKHHRVESFHCGEPALDDWLKHHALAAQASDSARVFVVTESGSPEVVAYFALAAAQVEPEEATVRVLKGQPSQRPVPAILLARFAVVEDHQGRGVGRSLLQQVLVRCATAADAIGARVLLVHAKSEAARAWYMQYEFQESRTDALHLMMLMKDLREFLRRQGID